MFLNQACTPVLKLGRWLAASLPIVVLSLTPTLAGSKELPTCDNPRQYQALLAAGDDIKSAVGDRESALRKAVAACPRNPVAYQDLTVLLLQQQKFQEAIPWIERGLEVAPSDVNLLRAQGTALLSLGQPEKALGVFKSLPLDAKTEFYIGMTYRALRDHREAREALAKSFAMGNRDPYVLYVLIEQDHDLRDTKTGLKDFQTFYQQFPHSPWLHLLLGNAYLAKNDYSHAEVEYRQAANLGPTLPSVPYSLGLIEFNRADYAAALEDFRKEIKIDPTFGLAYLYVGTSLRRMNKNSEALPYLEEAVARDPNFALAYRELAVAQIQAGQPEQAIRTLREGQRRFPSEPAFPAQLSRLLKARGDALAAQEQAALAQSLSQKGNQLIPSSSAQPASSAVGTEPNPPKLERLRKCIEQADAGCASHVLAELNDAALQQHPEYLNLKAQALNFQHHRKAALAIIQRAIRIDPNQPDYLMTEGRIYQQAGNQTEAIKCFLEAGKLKANPAEVLYDLGMSFFLLGNDSQDSGYYARAGQHFEKALKLDPKLDKAEFMLGVVNVMTSKLPEAKLRFEKALQLKPKNPYYVLHYGILLSRLGQTDEALRQMKLAETLAPSYPQTYLSLGALQARLGNYREAREQLEKGLRLDPQYPEGYYTLGLVYNRMGLKSKSREALRKFQQLKEQTQESTGPLGASPMFGQRGNAIVGPSPDPKADSSAGLNPSSPHRSARE